MKSRQEKGLGQIAEDDSLPPCMRNKSCNRKAGLYDQVKMNGNADVRPPPKSQFSSEGYSGTREQMLGRHGSFGKLRGRTSLSRIDGFSRILGPQLKNIGFICWYSLLLTYFYAVDPQLPSADASTRDYSLSGCREIHWSCQEAVEPLSTQ